MPQQQKHPTTTKSPGVHAVSPVAAVLIVVGIYFSAVVIGQLASGLVLVFSGWSESQTNFWFTESVAGTFVTTILIELLSLAFLLFCMKQARVTKASIGLVRPKLRYFGYTLLAYPPYFVLNAISALAANALLHVDLDQAQQTGFEHAISGTDLLMTFISLVILPPIVEEILMRGFLFSNLKASMSVVRATLITSIIFAIAHLQFGSDAPLLWSAAIDTFILSLILCYLRVKTGNLWAGIGLHALKNGLAFFVIFILPKLQS